MTGQYAELKKRINDADAVVIGASNGLSMADGYNIFANDAWFQKNFGDLQRRYGIRSVLEGAFYPYQTLEEKWGFSSRLASKVHFDAAPGYAMRRLRDIQDVFVLTTNADDSFELAGFAPEQVFVLEGGRVEMRCSAHCSNEVVKDLDAMERMAAAETDGRIPSELIPRCRHCGAPMEPNLADSDAFFRSPFWQEKAQAFSDFAGKHSGENIVVMEIGVGPHNQMLLQPIRSLAAAEPNATYAVLNMEAGPLPQALAPKTIALEGDLTRTLDALASA